MSFPTLDQEFNHVQNLPNQPKLSEGFTPELLKACFDRAGQDIQTYINETLLPALESCASAKSGAESLGSAAFGDIPAGTVHRQLTLLKAQKDALEQTLLDAAQGIFPPQSIPLELLEAALQTTLNEAHGRNARVLAFTTPGEHAVTVPRSGLYRLRMCGAGAAGTHYHPLFLDDANIEPYKQYSCRGGGAGASLEALVFLEAGKTYFFHLGAGGTPAEVEKSPAIAELQGYELMDLQTHIRENHWVCGGGESIFSDPDHNPLFSCEGADPTKKRVYAKAHGDGASALFLHPGESLSWGQTLPEADGLRPTELGISSTLGQGAEYVGDTGEVIPAGYGGGGHGALFYLSTPRFDLLAAPSKGGDGAAFLEFIQ